MQLFDSWIEIPHNFEGECFVKCWSETYWLLKNRIIHKDDGPAIIYDDGRSQIWYCNNQKHRVDGPAGIFKNSFKKKDYYEFWIFGKEYREQDYWNHPLVVEYKLKQIINL